MYNIKGASKVPLYSLIDGLTLAMSQDEPMSSDQFGS